MKTYGRYKDGTPNDVPAKVPLLNVAARIVRTRYQTWQYRRLGTTPKFQWDLIDPNPKALSEAAASIRAQCQTWGIPVVPEQWQIVRVEEVTVQALVDATATWVLTNM